VSPATRLVDDEVKATILPSIESDGSALRPVPCAPAFVTETGLVTPAAMTRLSREGSPALEWLS
jgi:hypothetical protein